MIQDARLVEAFGPSARTIETIVPEAELVKKLARGRPLRLKLGIDPTSPQSWVCPRLSFAKTVKASRQPPAERLNRISVGHGLRSEIQN